MIQITHNQTINIQRMTVILNIMLEARATMQIQEMCTMLTCYLFVIIVYVLKHTCQLPYSML